MSRFSILTTLFVGLVAVALLVQGLTFRMIGFGPLKVEFGPPAPRVEESGGGSGNVDGSGSDVALQEFVEDYYALLPQDTDAAWSLLTGSAHRLGGGRDEYDRFYGSLSAVRIVKGPTIIDDRTVQATLKFVKKNGTISVEPYELIVVRQGGTFLIEFFRRM